LSSLAHSLTRFWYASVSSFSDYRAQARQNTIWQPRQCPPTPETAEMQTVQVVSGQVSGPHAGRKAGVMMSQSIDLFLLSPRPRSILRSRCHHWQRTHPRSTQDCA
jgi:hypothetical protein